MRRTVSTVALGLIAVVGVAAVATSCGSSTAPTNKTYVANLIALDVNAVGTTAGPVIFNMFLPNGPTGTLNGEVAHGTFTNANNVNISLDSLRVLFNNGHAYTNVHTSANQGGEIRDQVHPSN